ncbi:MAG TPA: hypothetical protein VKT18_01855, partial [Acidimicrobiales bacterium]|nr:hypothetical protein [Acidimicrobiales bacterium]
MSPRVAGRPLREPASVFGVALLGSAALWGRLWVTSPTTRGVCGCGDPALFQWFLAWPAHAIATGHSLVFSRDLFHPAGINLLSNTSVLALGVPLAPITWLGGPVLTENVALLLSVPVAALTMDLLLRRLTASTLPRVVLSLFWGFSPFVLANLTESHLMLAWIGVLPLLALGVLDAASDDARRARRGQVLLGVALVVQFFLSTELLALSCLLGAIAGVVLLASEAVGWARARRVPSAAVLAVARRLAIPIAAAVVVLAAPAAYALLGPRALKGNIWGAGFNTGTTGSSLLDLLRPHATGGALVALTGYSGTPVVQAQLVGWGILLATVAIALWRFRDPVVRVAAVTTFAALALSLSTTSESWAPWGWLGRLPVLQDVVQLRVAVFGLFFAILVAARGVDALVRVPRVGTSLAVGALALCVVPVAVPEAQGLPLRTVHVSVPGWWRSPPHHGVVLSYPFPGLVIQSPLTWQAEAGFPVSLVGGSGPQGTPARAGADQAATVILDALTSPPPHHTAPVASPATAAPVRAMLLRDGVTEVVVPEVVRGHYLAAGRPSGPAVAFFTQVL